MPTIDTAKGPVTFCVLIPSRGRAELLAKTLGKMPWLTGHDVIIGVENKEWDKYRSIIYGARVGTFTYDNAQGSVAVAREALRRHAMSMSYDYFVVTDDNALHKSEAALHNLVRACAEYPTPCIMAGMHGTAVHFDRGKIGKANIVHGLTSYPAVAAIFQCYPRALYKDYVYPPDAYGLDDRHYYLWLLSQGHTEFRVCMDAPFTKSRYQHGGQGNLNERARKCGLAIARLASEFPSFVGAMGTLRIPWQHIIKTVDDGGTITGNRLVGGSMRKESTLQHSTRLTIRRKRSPQPKRR